MAILYENKYLDRMAKPLQEKLKVSVFISPDSKEILDVGCADGIVTEALANMFPQSMVKGIDLDSGFIKKAKDRTGGVKNISFETVYLRDLLPRNKRYDAVIFCSVLHEFFTYGEGTSSVIKALSDAHELLNVGGVLIIRDMVLQEFTKSNSPFALKLAEKIYKKEEFCQQVNDFERVYGKMNSYYTLNHFLLKYMYIENWDRELREHYVPVTCEQYEKILELLGMSIQYKQLYLIDYLRNKWKEDFDLTDEDTITLKSTAIIVAQKNPYQFTA